MLFKKTFQFSPTRSTVKDTFATGVLVKGGLIVIPFWHVNFCRSNMEAKYFYLWQSAHENSLELRTMNRLVCERVGE